MAEKKYEERDQFPTLIDGGQVDEAIVNTPPTEKGVFNTGITSTQIEQVVDLPVPTTDDEGKVLKVDAEGKWELAADAEGTVVVANPTLAGTEAELTGLQVGATKYKVPEGMQVLELTNESGTLTDEQFALAGSDNCIIKLGERYFYKFQKTQVSAGKINNIYRGVVYQDSVNFDFRYRLLTVYWDKSYSLGSITVVKANPTLDGTEPSLEGIQVGTSKYKVGAESPVAYEGTSLLPTDIVFSDWTLHRAIKDGNILWVVISGQIRNSGSDSQSVVNIMSISLPADIQNKIYRRDGTTINNSYSSDDTIANLNGNKGNATFIYRLYSNVAGEFKIGCNLSFSLSGGDYTSLELRIPIFLDIGTVAS